MMNKIAESLLLGTILVAFRTTALSHTKMQLDMIDILDYIYERGHLTDPPIGVAITNLKKGEVTLRHLQCALSFPFGLPVRWFMYLSEQEHTFGDLKDIMKGIPKSRRRPDLQVLQWGSIRFNKHGEVRNGSDKDVHLYQIPNIINGIFIRKINRTDDEKEYNILYSDYEHDFYIAKHTVSGQRIVSPKDSALFTNLTTLKNVFDTWKPNKDGPLLILYTAERGIQYTDIDGVPITGEGRVSQKYSVFVCVHERVRKYCFDEGTQEDCEIKYDSCPRCVSNVAMRNCQLDQNECEMDRTVLVQSGHTKCSPENKTLPNVQWETAYMNVSSNMCENNSTCVNTFGSFMCVCVDGWQGEYCDEDIDECKDELSKCHPDFGLCANTLGSYRCECFQKNMDQYCYPRNGAPSSQGIYALALVTVLTSYLNLAMTFW